MKKRLLALLLCGLLAASALVTGIHAAEDVGDPTPTVEEPAEPAEGGEVAEKKGFDLEAPVSLTITLRDPQYGNNLSDFTVYLWKVADIDPTKNTGSYNPGMFIPTEKFKDTW